MTSRVQRLPASAMCAVVLVATLGEGGSNPSVMLAVHGAIVALALWMLLGPRHWGVPNGASAPIGALVLFVALAVSGAVVAPYGYAALTRILEIAAFGAVLWIASRCGPGLAGWFALPLLVGAVGQSALALYQRYIEGVSRPAGTFLNPNHLAAWLVAVLLLAVAGTIVSAERRGVVLRSALAAPVVAVLLLTGSRGALLGLMAGAAWLSAVTWTKLAPRGRLVVVSGLTVIVVLAAAGVALRGLGFDPFRHHRVAIWKAALTPALDRPWTGVGPGQWDAAVNNLTFPLENGPLRFERVVDSTHSDLIRLVAEFGWPAAIAAMVGVALLAGEIRRRRRDGELEGASLGAAGALIALSTQALVDNLSVRPAVYLLAGTLAGALLSSRVERGARAGLAWRVGAVPVLLIVFVVADVGPFAAWEVLRQGPPAERPGEPESEVVLPTRLNPLHPEGWMRLAWYHASNPDLSPPQRYAAARNHAEHAVRLQSVDSRYRMGLARIEGLWFREIFRDEASRDRTAAHYRAAQELARHDAGIAIEEGAFLMTASDALGARRAAERALAIEPNSVPAKLLLASAVMTGGTPGATVKAARLLDEAEATARRWAEHPKESAYARFHLELDAEQSGALRDRIEATAAESDEGPLP